MVIEYKTEVILSTEEYEELKQRIAELEKDKARISADSKHRAEKVLELRGFIEDEYEIGDEVTRKIKMLVVVRGKVISFKDNLMQIDVDEFEIEHPTPIITVESKVVEKEDDGT